MKKLLITSSLLSVIAVNAVMAGTAFAWHPEGKIVKSVRNVTANGSFADANTKATAVEAKPGDSLEYKIVVTNSATSADNEYNDLYFLKVVDTLPAGLQLVTGSLVTEFDPSNNGGLKPGNTKTVTLTAKVTSTTEGATLDNKACFTGDSKVKDAPRAGCDNAMVTVKVPTGGSGGVTPDPTPEGRPDPEKPAVLPETGVATNLIAVVGASTILGYALRLASLKKREA